MELPLSRGVLFPLGTIPLRSAMRPAEFIRKTLALALFTSATTLVAQERRPAVPAPPTDPEQVRATPPRAAGYLERRYGLSAAEAKRRSDLEADVSKAADALAQKFPADFVASIIDHAPAYSVTVVFGRDLAMAEVQSQVPASVLPYLKIKRSRYTGDQISARRQAIANSLASQNLTGSITYDFRTDKFMVAIGAEESDANLLQRIPAELRSDVLVRKGYPSTFQTNVRPGDAIYGGWVLYDLNYRAQCTWGFPVQTTTDSRQSILTGAHCPGGQTLVDYTDHWVTMPPPGIN
jgi:hypothetical protein